MQLIAQREKNLQAYINTGIIMTFRKILLFILLVSVGCNRIKTGDTLTIIDVKRIQKLDLLDKDEKIYKFYSEFKNEVAGNFFTNERLAKYWIDERDKTKDQISFAFYPDIESIDTVYNAGATYSPYMLVTKKDKTQFKVYVDGQRKEVSAFFEEAIKEWTKKKNAK